MGTPRNEGIILTTYGTITHHGTGKGTASLTLGGFDAGTLFGG